MKHERRRRAATMIVLVSAAVVGGPSPVAAQDEPSASCRACHGGVSGAERTISQWLADSTHQELDCTDCHESISLDDFDAASAEPHGASVTPVDCAGCHDDEGSTYRKHGRLVVGSSVDIPTCSDCHGTHHVLPSSDLRSSVHPSNLGATCKSCHADMNLIRNHSVLRDEPLALYEASVHGSTPEDGTCVGATCANCHSERDDAGRASAHGILSATDPNSTVSRANVPKTCGQCHPASAEDFAAGIHGQLAQRGETDAPVCTDCHGEHGILPVSDLRSPVSAARLAQATCARCHESVALNERYGIQGGRARSYVDSYHGHKRKAGEVHVANCASCHGTHRILPHTDPRSSVHASNLQNTCGACHPGISSVFAQTPIHGNGTTAGSRWPDFFTVLYQWVIAVTIGLMLLHNLAHFLRRVRLQSSHEQVQRLSPGEVAQHWLLMVSFVVLVISGFSLRFSEAAWVQFLFGWGGGAGFVIRGTVHRVSAVALIAWAIWHLIYWFTRRGRRWLRDMMVSWRDIRELKGNVRFFLGREKTHPRFGRFSYIEKAEYWALIWGTVIMGVTGLLLWFENPLTERWHVSKILLDVAQVIHYYEAWLATLAIIVWHGYATLFNPSVYPMNPAWLSGKMPKDMYDEEHPGA